MEQIFIQSINGRTLLLQPKTLLNGDILSLKKEVCLVDGINSQDLRLEQNNKNLANNLTLDRLRSGSTIYCKLNIQGGKVLNIIFHMY